MGIKELKRDYIIDVATDLFTNESINKITIKDIADKALVGEATIYRYFGNKHNIVIKSVIKLQNMIYNDYFNTEKGVTGFEKLKIFYNSYLSIFKEHINLYKFIGQFDMYILNEESIELSDYENEIDRFKHLYMEAYYLGLQDKTIQKQNDIESFYYASAHATIELCKKLAINGDIISQDREIVKEKEVEALIDMILYKLKAKNI